MLPDVITKVPLFRSYFHIVEFDDELRHNICLVQMEAVGIYDGAHMWSRVTPLTFPSCQWVKRKVFQIQTFPPISFVSKWFKSLSHLQLIGMWAPYPRSIVLWNKIFLPTWNTTLSFKTAKIAPLVREIFLGSEDVIRAVNQQTLIGGQRLEFLKNHNILLFVIVNNSVEL